MPHVRATRLSVTYPCVLGELLHGARKRLIALKRTTEVGARAGALSAGTWCRGHGVGTDAREEDVEGGVRRAAMTDWRLLRAKKPTW